MCYCSQIIEEMEKKGMETVIKAEARKGFMCSVRVEKEQKHEAKKA